MAMNHPPCNTEAPGTVVLPDLIATVYEAAPPAERKKLLEQMIKPLGLLSLTAVANGMFARFAPRGPWAQVHIRPDDVQGIQAQDVAALADFLQQLGIQAFDGVYQVLNVSPVLMGTTAAAVLVAWLTQQLQRRKASADEDFDPP